MAKLEDSIDYVLENEGGFCIDDGGPTNFGIVRADVAKYRKVPIEQVTLEDMKELSKMEATEIYREQYWNPLSLDLIDSMNVATAIFDIGVNRGISVGAKYAQKAAVMSGHPDLVVDGQIGPKSIAAINSVWGSSFIRKLESLDMAGYEAIVAHNPAMAVYRVGWEKRAARLLTLA